MILPKLFFELKPGDKFIDEDYPYGVLEVTEPLKLCTNASNSWETWCIKVKSGDSTCQRYTLCAHKKGDGKCFTQIRKYYDPT